MSVRQKKFVSVIAQCIHIIQWSVPSEYDLACTEDVPTCGDACDKVALLLPVLIQPEPLVLVYSCFCVEFIVALGSAMLVIVASVYRWLRRPVAAGRRPN